MKGGINRPFFQCTLVICHSFFKNPYPPFEIRLLRISPARLYFRIVRGNTAAHWLFQNKTPQGRRTLLVGADHHFFIGGIGELQREHETAEQPLHLPHLHRSRIYTHQPLLYASHHLAQSGGDDQGVHVPFSWCGRF